MSERADIQAALGYKQLYKAYDLLEDTANKILSTIQSQDVVDWRVPELQLELARVYEALSRDGDVELSYAAAAESARRIEGCPTTEALVHFAYGEFCLRRRMYQRALDVADGSQLSGGDPYAWLLCLIRAHAYSGLNMRSESVEAAKEYVAGATNKEGAMRQVKALLESATKDG